MPFNKGKFRSTQDTHHNPSAGEKVAPASSPKEKQSAAHGEMQPEHVTKTHPGQTQPHPTTGVHAFMGMHKGGGKYQSHTHHEDGTVETRHHENADEMHQAQQETLPGDAGNMSHDQNEEMGGQDFSETLGGIGGGDSY
jgi:hypothetical protein